MTDAACYYEEGGWLAEAPPSTGSTFSQGKTAKAVSWLSVLLVGVGSGAVGNAASSDWPRFPECRCGMATELTSCAGIAPSDAMPPADQVELVRKVFSPAVAELAEVFGVTRQAVYNWLNGAPPTGRHLDKLTELANAAKTVEDAGIPVTGWMMRRKMFAGKRFMEFVRDGGSAQEAASMLVRTLRTEAEQRQWMDARLAGRKTAFRSPESDLPAANDVEG